MDIPAILVSIYKNKKIGLIITSTIDEKFIKDGNTTILQQEQDEIILEMMGLKRGQNQEYNKPNDDDEEFREVQITDSAGSYFQINYGAKALIITDNVSYKELHLSVESQYKKEQWDSFDVIILEKQPNLEQQFIQDMQKYAYNLLIIVDGITQEEIGSGIQKPLQSRNQYKYLEVNHKQKQLALIHTSNYAKRVDEITSISEINDLNSYIRRNSIRVQCLWREILTYLEKFPKYGA